MHCYECYWYVFVAIKTNFWDTNVYFCIPIIRTVYLREQGCEDPWLFFEAKRGPRAKEFGNAGLKCCRWCMSGWVTPGIFYWRAPQQMLRTHRSLEGLMCNPMRKMMRFFLLFHCNGAPMEWNWQGKTEVLGENPVPVPLFPPQIPHGLTRDRNRASAVGDRRLTAWATARPNRLLLCRHKYPHKCISRLLIFYSIKQNLGRGKSFFSSQNRPYRLWGPTNFLFYEQRGSFQGVQRPGRNVDLSHPPTAEVKSGALPLLPPYAFTKWTGGTLLLYLSSTMCVGITVMLRLATSKIQY
jgi:hypothetical protein